MYGFQTFLHQYRNFINICKYTSRDFFKMKRINIYITEDTDRQIDALSELLQVTRSEIIRTAIESYSATYEESIQMFIENLDFSDEMEFSKKANPNIALDNPENFIDSGVCINTKDHGIQKLTLFPFQKQFLFKLDNYQKLIINKSRQSGINTVLAAYTLYYCMTHSDKTIAISSYCLQASAEMLETIDIMQQNLPNSLKNINRCIGKTKREMKFSNGSSIYAMTSASPDSFRGMEIDFLILDEFARTPVSSVYELMKIIDVMKDTNPNMKIIISSIPDGINYFYKLWADAITNFNEYHAIKIPWSLLPGRDNSWKQQEIKVIGYEKFLQEYECSFYDGTKGDLYA